MELGKLLCIIGGVVTLLATYIFAWFIIDIGGTDHYGHGLGILFNIPNTFKNAETIAADWGSDVPTFAIYIVEGCFIFFLFSGLLILLGVKNRVIPIIGAIMPVLIAIAIISGPFNVPPNVITYIEPLSSETLGGFPLNLAIGPSGHGASVSLGNYLLLAGGVLGIIGGIWPRE